MLKIAHSVLITPNRCGLYETARELAQHVRELGHDARLVDPNPSHGLTPEDGQDRGVPIADEAWALEADLIVNHSGIDGSLDAFQGPVVHVCHGRPYYSFHGERTGGAPVYSYMYHKSKDDRFKAVVTFWKEHIPYLQTMWGQKKVHHIPATCDLKRWSPGHSDYDFHSKGGDINIVITDPWREDVDPFWSINAFSIFRCIVPKAKLHIYAAPENRRGLDALLQPLRDTGHLGEVLPWVKGLEHIYRAADLMITPHKIWTRSIREAMACDCQTVTGRDWDPFDTVGFANKMKERLEHPRDERGRATCLFDPKLSALQFVSLIEQYATAAVS